MTDTNIFSEPFYHAREVAVRQQFGSQLDGMKKNLSQLQSPCLSRMMKIQKATTFEELLAVEPDARQTIIAAILYNDAFWRIESAYLMLTLGMLNVVYSNLRSCLESVVKAHVVENLDDEAINFIKTGNIDQSKISQFIPEDYDNHILAMKKAFSNWGTHSHLTAIQLSGLFGPNIFDIMVSKTTIQHPQKLDDSFVDAAKKCYTAMGDVFLMFMWIMSKGTSYHRAT